mgnify:CR=1 FL=1
MHYPFRRKGGISMTCTKDYREHIEYTFHAFCKVVKETKCCLIGIFISIP